MENSLTHCNFSLNVLGFDRVISFIISLQPFSSKREKWPEKNLERLGREELFCFAFFVRKEFLDRYQSFKYITTDLGNDERLFSKF